MFQDNENWFVAYFSFADFEYVRKFNSCETVTLLWLVSPWTVGNVSAIGSKLRRFCACINTACCLFTYVWDHSIKDFHEFSYCKASTKCDWPNFMLRKYFQQFRELPYSDIRHLINWVTWTLMKNRVWACWQINNYASSKETCIYLPTTKTVCNRWKSDESWTAARNIIIYFPGIQRFFWEANSRPYFFAGHRPVF